jgi:hypothetical protein
MAVYDATEPHATAGYGLDAGEWDVLVLVAYDYERDEPLDDRPVGVEIQSFSGFGRWDAIPSFGCLWRPEGRECYEPRPLGELLREEQRRSLSASLEIVRRIDASLRAVEGDAEALPEYAEDWVYEGFEPDAQVGFRIEWSSLMRGDLPRLERALAEGTMSDEQERRYGGLKALLRERMPLIERMDLARPAVPLGNEGDEGRSKS